MKKSRYDSEWLGPLHNFVAFLYMATAFLALWGVVWLFSHLWAILPVVAIFGLPVVMVVVGYLALAFWRLCKER